MSFSHPTPARCTRAVTRLPFVREFDCEAGPSGAGAGTVVTNAGQVRNSPVFGLKYSSVYTKLLAMGDEDGFVSVLNTAAPPPDTLDDNGPTRASAQWTAHRNAIFELEWAKDDTWIYTASGDTTLALWDTAYATRLARFRGHTGSVKSLSVSPSSPHVLASGGRDGRLLLWDGRTPEEATSLGEAHRPVAVVLDPHAPAQAAGRSRPRPPLQGRPGPSVTALRFLPSGSGHVLASAGVDGVVRLWDVRHAGAQLAALPGAGADVAAGLDHLVDSSVPRLGTRNHAVTHLALHPDGAQLLVSLTGGHHLMYCTARPDAGPTRWYGGHTVSSFYVKAAFSPDGSHFVSGSSDGGAYVWQVDGADGGAPYVLRGHSREVTTGAWCPTDFCQLATAADDCTVKIWNVQRAQAPEARDPPGRRGGALARVLLLHQPAARFWDVSNAFAAAPHTLEALPGLRTPVGAAAVGGAQAVARSSGGATPRSGAPSTGMRISNALRLGKAAGQRKRTKQQTLAQALGAARAAAALGAANHGGGPQGGGGPGRAGQQAAKRARCDSGGGGGGSPGGSAEVRRPSSTGGGPGSQDENAGGGLH